MVVFHSHSGLLDYAAAYELQMRHHAELAGSQEPVAHVLFLEHSPVYTLGRATRPEHLLMPREELARKTGIPVVTADRGGSVTYHGPGQLTAYVLLNLKVWGWSIHQHLWALEQAAIQGLAAFGLKGQRAPGMTGVWVADSGSADDGASGREGAPTNATSESSDPLAKICAIGVGCRRWVTYHGLSLNVDMDLSPFEHIDPCGLGRRPVTSLARCLGRCVSLAEAEEALRASIGNVFGERGRNP
jgi:lipoyl(octanoyl) transferase